MRAMVELTRCCNSCQELIKVSPESESPQNFRTSRVNFAENGIIAFKPGARSANITGSLRWVATAFKTNALLRILGLSRT